LLNLNHLLAARHCLGRHDRLRAGFEISCTLRFAPHTLDCIHHVSLLCEECISQIGGPLDVARHALYHVWIHHQSLNTWIPRLLCHCIRQCFVLQVWVVSHPLLELDDFKRISGCSERLCQKWIRVQRNRRDE
jgi:hypothetical protein